MSLQELVDYHDSHPEHQEEIMSNSWKYWNMESDEMIEELNNSNISVKYWEIP